MKKADLAKSRVYTGVFLFFFVVYLMCLAYLFHFGKPKFPVSSVTDLTGVLRVYGHVDSVIPTEEKLVRDYRFSDKDYSILSGYTLFSTTYENNFPEVSNTIEIPGYGFRKIYCIHSSAPSLYYTIACRKNGIEAKLLPKDKTGEFTGVYNDLIAPLNYRCDISSDVYIKQYFMFIMTVLYPDYDVIEAIPGKNERIWNHENVSIKNERPEGKKLSKISSSGKNQNITFPTSETPAPVNSIEHFKDYAVRTCIIKKESRASLQYLKVSMKIFNNGQIKIDDISKAEI